MKLRDKLILSFCVILVVPLGVLLLAPLDVGVSVLLMLAFAAVGLVAWIYGSILRRIQSLAEAADCIKEGDLTVHIDTDGGDELSDLAVSLEAMRRQLMEDAEEKRRSGERERQLIQNIAHDLKTPLTSIQGYAQGLLDGVANTAEKRERYLSTIDSKAREADALLNELADYARVAGEAYHKELLSVPKLLSGFVSEMATELERRGVDFSYVNEAGDDVRLLVDRERLHRALHNVFENALRYMGRRDGRIVFGVTEGEGVVCLSVADNGKGISQMDLPHIFERTYRGDAARNSSVPGSGLGLAIVRQILLEHGGDVTAESREGEGARMTLMLPVYEGAPEAAASALSPKAQEIKDHRPGEDGLEQAADYRG